MAARSGRLWQLAAECIADRLHVAWRSVVRGGEMLAGSTAGPCPLARCRDVGVKRRVLPCGLSPTNYSLQYRGWLSVLDVSGQTGPSGCTELPSPS